ncbi:MAG: mechanosensitive ion channel [Nannocystaceae bacterium]
MDLDPSALTPEITVLEQLRLGGLLSALLVFATTFVIVRLATSTLSGLGGRFLDKRLLLNQIATVGRFALWSIGLLLAVRALSLPREVLIGLSGGAAVTIGFALKDLVASILAGLTIVIDRPFQVGDRVAFGEYYGEISSIGLRSVRLITLDDNVVTIPNNKFLTDAVASGNAGALDMLIQLDFYVGLDQDVRQAKHLVEQCLVSNRYVYTRKPWVVLVSVVMQGNYPAIRLRGKAYVLDVQYEKAFETDVSERVIAAFREHKILPPAILHRSIDGAPTGAGEATREPSTLTAV